MKLHRTDDTSSQLSNEFGFEVAAFHHAHEAYLVPEVLKRAYSELSHHPTLNLYDDGVQRKHLPSRCSRRSRGRSSSLRNHVLILQRPSRCRYKREAYRHSEFAPRVLADEGLDVIMKVASTFMRRTIGSLIKGALVRPPCHSLEEPDRRSSYCAPLWPSREPGPSFRHQHPR